MYGNPPDGSGNLIWNYWQPAGPWDYVDYTDANPTDPKLWIGTHPNNGYYQIDTLCIVAAFEHGVVFNEADISTLVTDAKTSWMDGDPASPVAGMEISVQPASGTAKAINACFLNSKTLKPASAGARALNGTVLSVEWDTKTNKGRIVVRPNDAQTRVTVFTGKDTKVQVLRMWSALAPYDVEIQKDFEATEQPDSWGGLSTVPYYLMLQLSLRGE